MKQALALVFAGQFLIAALTAPVVNAQSASGAPGAPGQGQATVITPISSPPTPVGPPTSLGFIQFNNLTIETISGATPPAEIVANNPDISPMMGASSAGAPAKTAVTTPTASISCYKFETQDSAAGQAISCPTPQSVSGAAGNTPSPTMYPQIYPISSEPYRIEVGASTTLMLRDRTVATLGNFSSGDQINVFGYYNSNGSIQAYLIRDLSKPVQDQFLQLNNVNLVSISTSTNPTTLVVAQAQGYPCFGFGTSGAPTQQLSIACPMGISANADNPALQNLSVPAAMMPNWQMLRKYVITIDAQTIILDSNRTILTLSSLQIGDSLNIYGDTTDNGQTLTADIVRDLSLPAAPSTFSGQVTQVNANGSFIIQTNGGQTITVTTPIQVGATVQITGLLDRLKNILTQISNIYFKN